MQRKRQVNVVTNGVPKEEDRLRFFESFHNLFFLIHRLIQGWPLMQSFMITNFGRAAKAQYFSLDSAYVWTSALKALMRLQETYNISTEDLASGVLGNNYSYSYAKFTASKCLDVGVFYYQLRHPERAVEWLLAAQWRTKDDATVTKVKIMEYLYLANCFKGDEKSSKDILTKLLQEFPSFHPSDDLRDDHELVTNIPCHVLTVKMKKTFSKNQFDSDYSVSSGRMCRKENYHPPNDSRLRCRLIHYNQRHLIVQPYKMEELHLEPPLLLFHEAIHNGEVDFVKYFVNKKIRSTHSSFGRYNETYSDNPDHYQSYMWPSNKSNKIPFSRTILLRSASIANIDTYKADPVLVTNYGVGGELRLHDDSDATKDDYVDEETKPDYATVMYYLNNVAEGGYTVFTHLGVTVQPKKGIALFWFNRYPDRFPLFDMEHAGCPVLHGTKWIAVQWLHALGQDFPKCLPGKEKSYKYFYLRS